MRCVHDRTCEWISIYDGKLYCFAMGNNGGYLTRMNPDGGNIEQLVWDSADYINVTASGIFFVCGNDKRLEWLGFDGRTRSIIVSSRTGKFNMAGDWIFYVNRDDDEALWRVRIDGSDNQRVSADDG